MRRRTDRQEFRQSFHDAENDRQQVVAQRYLRVSEYGRKSGNDDYERRFAQQSRVDADALAWLATNACSYFLGRYKSVLVPKNTSADCIIVSDKVGCGWMVSA